jgi:hypothetical protein
VPMSGTPAMFLPAAAALVALFAVLRTTVLAAAVPSRTKCRRRSDGSSDASRSGEMVER